MSQEMLNETVWNSEQVREAYPVAERRSTMTLGGVIVKALFLLVIVAALATLGWQVSETLNGVNFGLLYLLGFILLIAITIAAANNPRLAAVAGLLYALLTGLWIGSITRYYATAFDGIVFLALAGTVAVCCAVLLLYLIAPYRVTARVVQVIVALSIGVGLLYLVGFFVTLFGGSFDILYGSSPASIVVGLIILGVAASNLLIDFKFIDEGIRLGAPRQMEWYAALGLVSTLVWVYLEMLRLLARIARNR